MKNWHPKGMATGIGSLPHRTTAEAVNFIKEYLPDFPHWPQLPQGEVKEGFIEQSVYPLINFGLVRVVANPGENERLVFTTDQADWLDNLTEFYSQYLAVEEGDSEALNKFALPPAGVKGFYAFLEALRNDQEPRQMIKGQVTGPVSVGFSITDPERRAAYYDPQLRDVIVKTVQLQAKWQARQIKTLGYPVFISIDDPGIYACGLSTHITLTKEMIQEDLKAIIETIQQEEGLSGVHICAGSDWSIILETEVDVLFFDAYEYFESLAPFTEAINKFLERGGVIGWGIVPTSEKIAEEDTASLYNKLQEQINTLVKRGVQRDQLIQQALITPTCGTGLLSLEQANKIYASLKGLSELWRNLYN